ncbi:MAG: hypothetical protein ACKO24_13205 [Leptolyngbyaceae cyanobacterium]
MTANNVTRPSSRRGKGAQKTDQTTDEAMLSEDVLLEAAEAIDQLTEKTETSEEEAMPSDNVVKITARPVQEEQKGEMQLHQPTTMVWNRPVMPSEIEVKETIVVAGVRPIEASHLALFGSFLNGRPIAASPIQVAEMLPGDRPIFVSEFHMVEGLTLPGERPVMVSDPQLMQASVLPGGRPIASNDIIDPEPATLMGYLD